MERNKRFELFSEAWKAPAQPLYQSRLNLEEEVGFEPTEVSPSPIFKIGAIDHSATLPKRTH